MGIPTSTSMGTVMVQPGSVSGSSVNLTLI